jgi:hypothetical protein
MVVFPRFPKTTPPITHAKRPSRTIARTMPCLRLSQITIPWILWRAPFGYKNTLQPRALSSLSRHTPPLCPKRLDEESNVLASPLLKSDRQSGYVGVAVSDLNTQ